MAKRDQIVLKLLRGGAQSLTDAECVSLIGDLLVSMIHRGVYIRDYDHKGRSLFGVRRIKGRYYFLAAQDAGEEDGGDGGTL